MNYYVALFFLSSIMQAQQNIPLYCFEKELNQLLESETDVQLPLEDFQKDRDRLSQLKSKVLDCFWHLDDPVTGMKLLDKEEQSLSSYFSLWDLAPTKGAHATIAIIDSLKDSGIINLKNFCSKCANISQGDRLKTGYCMIEKFKNVSLCGRCYNEIFFYFLKNISKFHGMITSNIIIQLAPQATVASYNIFDDYGYSENKKMFHALSDISERNFDIVNLGCKITPEAVSLQDQEKLDDLFKHMNYIVAASGNDQITEQSLSYPARNKHVCFDVGAFYKNQNTNQYFICPFSQYELGNGPKIVAPGLGILCPFTCHDYTMGFAFLSGTSIATAIVSGLLALVISEFKQTFSYKQLLTVLYRSTQKLDKTPDWQEGVLLGALDIRAALLCLHVLQEVKQIALPNRFSRSFEKLVEDFFIINNMYLYLDSENKESIHNFLKNYRQKNNVKKRAFYLAEILLSLHQKLIGKIYLKKSFDKKLVYLLRTIKSGKLVSNASVLKHEKVQFALNRKQ